MEDLKDRLIQSLAGLIPQPYDTEDTEGLITAVTLVIRAMEGGVLTLADVRAVFSSIYLPGFSIELWVGDRVEEGVYLENGLAEAA